jgi:hypothetical protein
MRFVFKLVHALRYDHIRVAPPSLHAYNGLAHGVFVLNLYVLALIGLLDLGPTCHLVESIF